VAEHLSDRGTRVVVIAAPGTPEDLVRCLQACCGLERTQITVVPPTAGREELLRSMTRAAGQATGLLLVWYIGPSALDASGRLALITGAQPGPGPQAAAGMLLFEDMVTALAARRRSWPTLIVLDCPQADQVVLTQPEWGLLARAEADPDHPAGIGLLTDPLVRLLEHGIPAGPGQLTLGAAHGYLARAMTASGLAPPQLTGSASLRELILGPNPALSPAGGRNPAGSRPGARDRRLPRMARLGLALTGLFAATVVLTVVAAMFVFHTRPAARPAAAARSGRAHVAASTGAAQLSGVSCTSPTACTAVGNTGSDAAEATPLAERWNGRTWTIQPTPSPPAATTGALLAVSCTSPTACIAVGSTSGHSTTGAPLAERWNGRTWIIQPTPSPPAAKSGSLSGVSCTSETACTAVGAFGLRNGSGMALAERWNGRSWAIQPTPGLPAPTSGLLSVSYFQAVSCTSATACTAVGQSGTTGLGRRPVTAPYLPLAERWNGTSWAIQPVPAPVTASATSFSGVQCTSATACTAVGGAALSNGSAMVLTEYWNGTQWAILPGPVSSSSLDAFASVSCPSRTTCTAVGRLYTAAIGLAAGQWNGTQWAITTALPDAGGTPGSTLSGVSCTSPAACIAVGQSDGVPLAESWNGTQWSTQPIGALPVMYNLGGAQAAAWNNPERSPATFPVFADGSAAIIRMRWARWNHTTAVTSSATYYDRSGPCCTQSDQHYHQVTVTLSQVQYSGGPRPGSYFDRMVIAGRGFRTLTYTYEVSFGDLTLGGWTGGAS
jgi:hypothetical protein